MWNLAELMKGLIDEDFCAGAEKVQVSNISADSRDVKPGTLFFAVPGTTVHGELYIQDAIAKGACAVVTSISYEDDIPSHVYHLPVRDTKDLLEKVAERFFSYPSHSVKVIGITGTNGKTTITYLLESIFQAKGNRTGVIGTVNYRIGKDIFPSKNTTPGIIDNQRLLSVMKQKDVEYCFMEVSSHALDQGRHKGIDFRTAIFTNLTQDHLDYHQTMEQYFEAKSKLFTWLKGDAVAIINKDDSYGRSLISKISVPTQTYGINQPADIIAKNISVSLTGTNLCLQGPLGDIAITTSLIGRHNIYNILAAVSTAIHFGCPPEVIQEGIENLKSVPGRLEPVANTEGIYAFVDYAHTPDALKNVLETLLALKEKRLILLFGCGGDRDKGKRPQMGKVAEQYADYVILTNDNPRTEEPMAIIQDITSGMQNKNYEVILDRKEGIKRAISVATEGDIVLIAGKGHEKYQIFGHQTISFDDCQEVRKVLHVND